MRTLLLLALLTGLLSVSTAWRHFMRGRQRSSNVHKLESSDSSEQWFSQRLDHFAPENFRMWQQRYFVNTEFYKQGGPIFLMINGEAEAAPKWITSGAWIEYAKQFGAMCFLLEHRYYGKSHPTPDLSTKNLLYLKAEQALGDLSYFILNATAVYNIPKSSKWIVFGGSYAGNLAAWMRLKYPHLVHGAVSASGPLLAKVDFQEYLIAVENALKGHSQACVDTVAAAQQQFHVMLRHRIGQQGLEKKFRLCDPIDPGHTTRSDIANLYQTLADTFAGIVQTNENNRNNSQTANLTVNSLCDILVNESNGIPIDRLAFVNNLVLNASGEKCLDYRYSKMIHELRNITWASEQAEGGRQWMYQTCTEFGYFQTSTATSKLFSDTFPKEFFIQECIDIFGPKYNEHLVNASVELTNRVYGGLDIKTTNVVYVHGSVDPWHVLGLTNSNDPAEPTIYINGAAHCAAMYPPSEKDSPQLKQARIQIANFIKQWLEE